MEDEAIVALFWQRDERAVAAAADKYGAYCSAIARNILGSPEEAEECVNDTYLSAWNAMPPHRPARLATFLGKLTRNLAINRYKHLRADRRGGGNGAAVLEELEEVVSGGEDASAALDARELTAAIHEFLGALPAKKRGIFLCRYWYADPVAQIARRYGMKEGAVTVLLGRLRRQLKDFLTERGFSL